jgi:hypothetical protein
MLDQGCPIEFFRVQRSYTFLSVRGIQIFLNALYYSCKKFIKDL